MTPSAIRIEVRTTNMMARANRPTTGGVWLDVDGTPFPSSEWDDFVVAFLGALLPVVVSARRFGVAASVSFYDGPFEVAVAKEGSDQWRVQLRDDRTGRVRDVHLNEVGMQAFEGSVRLAARAVLREVERLGAYDRDAVALRRELERA